MKLKTTHAEDDGRHPVVHYISGYLMLLILLSPMNRPFGLTSSHDHRAVSSIHAPRGVENTAIRAARMHHHTCQSSAPTATIGKHFLLVAS